MKLSLLKNLAKQTSLRSNFTHKVNLTCRKANLVPPIKKHRNSGASLLVEMARFELASEDPFPKLSTSVVYLLSFPSEIADKQAKSKGSPLNPYKLQGSHLCRCTAKMTPLTESRYFQSGWAAIKQQLKLFYYCQLFLSCDFYSGATPLLAYLGSKSPSKSFHPRVYNSEFEMRNSELL